MNHHSTAANYRAWFWTLALIGFLADQGTKYAAYFEVKPATEQAEPIPERTAFSGPLTLIVTPVSYDQLNTGALGGVGKQAGDSSNWILAGVCLLAIAIIIGWSFRPNFAASRYLCISVGFLLAGATGNLYDRIVFKGVRDFLQLWYGDKQTPLTYIFNLADFWLICGAAMLLLQALFVKADAPAKVPEPESAAPVPAAPEPATVEMKS